MKLDSFLFIIIVVNSYYLSEKSQQHLVSLFLHLLKDKKKSGNTAELNRLLLE